LTPVATASTATAELGSAGAASTIGQFARYLIVGGVAFAVDFATLAALTEAAGLHYLVSAAVAFLAGLGVNYILSRAWVFGESRVKNAAAEFALFALIGVVGLALNETIIWTVSAIAGRSYLLGKLASAGLVLLWNFGARKYFLFRNA